MSFQQVAKLLAADGAFFEQFGSAVAVSESTALVGAEDDDNERGTEAGSAYLFERDAGGPNSWGQVAKLMASDGASLDAFGTAVSISGDTLVVAAPGNDDLGGSAYVFERDAGGFGAWGEVAKITAADGAQYDVFGAALALSGDTVVVGAPWDDDLGNKSGAAYVFERDAGGPSAWGQVAKLLAADGAEDDAFGGSVAISDQTIVVGVGGVSVSGTEAAYIFKREAGGPGGWGQVAKLTPTHGGSEGHFGWSAAISGDTVVVGAFGDDDLYANSGAAFVFRRDYGGQGAWGQVAKLTAADGYEGDSFGFSVGISDGLLVSGAVGADQAEPYSGSAYVFQRDAGGPEAWGQVAKLVASDGDVSDYLGESAAISGRTVLLSARGDDDLGVGAGAAYVFEEATIFEDGFESGDARAWETVVAN